jgi:selenocysteine lyase/cysteine desulfurase
MASKNKSGGASKRARRSPAEVIAEYERRLNRAKARQEHKELLGSPTMKALGVARSSVRRLINVEDPDDIITTEIRKSAAAALALMDELALKFGGHIRKERAA